MPLPSAAAAPGPPGDAADGGAAGAEPDGEAAGDAAAMQPTSGLSFANITKLGYAATGARTVSPGQAHTATRVGIRLVPLCVSLEKGLGSWLQTLDLRWVTAVGVGVQCLAWPFFVQMLQASPLPSAHKYVTA